MLPQKTGGIFSTDFIENTRRQLTVPVHLPAAKGSIQNKIHVIEKWLQHGMSRFSKETLQSFLDYLMNYLENATSGRHKLQSTADIQKCLTKMKVNTNGKLSDDDRRSLNFFHNFTNDVNHFRVIKTAFDQEIYDWLYDYYYDPTQDPLQIEQQRRMLHKNGKVPNADAETEAAFISPRRLGVSTLDIISGDANEKLSVIVHELEDIKTRWQNLLSEEDINLDDFDPDSEHELHHLSAYGSYEPVFRLIPDMFTKCYKCVELAKQWLNLAPKVYPSLPMHKAPTVISKHSAKPAKPQSMQTSNIPPRPKTSKPQSSRSNAARQRIAIQKPRVAKYKPNPGLRERGPTESSLLSLNLDECASEGNTSRLNSSLSLHIPQTTYRVDPPSEYSASVLSGSFSSDTSIPQLRPQSSIDLPDSDYNNLLIKLRNTNRNIDDLEISLQNNIYELEALHSRDGRTDSLGYKNKSVNKQLEGLQQSQNFDQAQYAEMEEKMAFALSGTSKFFEGQKRLAVLKNQMQQRENEMKMLIFQISVIEQDYDLEAEMKPNFENFAADLEREIQETESLLEDERNEKLEIEEEIAIVKPRGSVILDRELTLESQRSSLGTFSETQSELHFDLVQSGSQGSISDRYEVVTVSSSSLNRQSDTTLALDRKSVHRKT